ncbi:MAG: MBL fold metallo-hydrolase [Gluconacetobacter sp.]
MPPSSLPVSDHCDGRRFFNPSSILPASPQRRRVGLGEILRWQWRRRRLPAWPPPTVPPPAGDPQALPAPGTVHVTFIGHSTFLLRLPRADGTALTVLTDPVFSDRCSPVSWAGPRRVLPPGRSLDALPRVDVVLVSHCHYDHLDLPSLAALGRRDAPLFITAPGNARHIRKAGARAIVECDWWQHHDVGGMRVTATPARHGSARTPFDANRALWCGFDIRPAGDGPSPSVFFAGDSGHGRHWAQIGARLGAPDIALLPVGAYDPRFLMEPVHVTPEEAVSAMIELDAGLAVGMHYGTFRLTDEPYDEPLRRLAAARAAAGVAAERFVGLGHGECRVMTPRRPERRGPARQDLARQDASG